MSALSSLDSGGLKVLEVNSMKWLKLKVDHVCVRSLTKFNPKVG